MKLARERKKKVCMMTKSQQTEKQKKTEIKRAKGSWESNEERWSAWAELMSEPLYLKAKSCTLSMCVKKNIKKKRRKYVCQDVKMCYTILMFNNLISILDFRTKKTSNHASKHNH